MDTTCQTSNHTTLDLHASFAVNYTQLDHYDILSVDSASTNTLDNIIATTAIPAVFSVLAALGLVGNSLVICVVLSDRRMRTSTNALITSLALADLLFIAICVPFTAVAYALSVWPLGSAWCKIYNYVNNVTAYVSVYTLILMAVDRYLAVVHPIESLGLRTERNAWVVVGAVWAAMVALNVPVLLQHGLHEYLYDGAVHRRCMNVYILEDDAEQRRGKTFYACFGFFAYLLPLSVITLLYVLMLRHLPRVSAVRGRGYTAGAGLRQGGAACVAHARTRRASSKAARHPGSSEEGAPVHTSLTVVSGGEGSQGGQEPKGSNCAVRPCGSQDQGSVGIEVNCTDGDIGDTAVNKLNQSVDDSKRVDSEFGLVAVVESNTVIDVNLDAIVDPTAEGDANPHNEQAIVTQFEERRASMSACEGPLLDKPQRALNEELSSEPQMPGDNTESNTNYRQQNEVENQKLSIREEKVQDPDSSMKKGVIQNSERLAQNRKLSLTDTSRENNDPTKNESQIKECSKKEQKAGKTRKESGVTIVEQSTKERKSSQSNERTKANRRVTRMVVVVIVAFALCWLPWHLVNFFHYWLKRDVIDDVKAFLIVKFLATCLAYMNSCVNPFLYAFLSSNFRRSFRLVLSCRRAS